MGNVSTQSDHYFDATRLLYNVPPNQGAATVQIAQAQAHAILALCDAIRSLNNMEEHGR